MALTPLSKSVRGRMRSGVAITCLAQCVMELVDNSIDAGASCIAVRVDLSKFKLQVVDNGRGISQSDLSLVGERYVTSKCHTLHDLDHNLQHLGYRGEALASTVNVSRMVEISSRHHLSQSTYDKVYLNGHLVGVTVAKTQRPSVGTTVTVLDFFYNMPVRRKTMVDVLELEQVKKAVECIALVHPSVSFSVRNDTTGALALQTHKTNSVLSSFGLLFAGNRVGKMRDVRISHSKFSVTGLISTEAHHNNSLQLIYINRRIVKKTQLHACINSQLNNSLLTKKFSQRDSTKQSLAMNPSRILDKYPVYVLMIECPRSEYDICLEPAKTLVEFKDWDGILSILTTLAKKFLEQYYLYLGLGPASTQTTRSDSVKQCTAAQVSSCGVKESSAPLVQSRVVRQHRRKRDIVDSSITGVGRDPSSHNLLAPEKISSSPIIITSQTKDSVNTFHNHPSLHIQSPSSFLLTTHNIPNTTPKPFTPHSSPHFLIPFRSPSPKQTQSSILTRIMSSDVKSSPLSKSRQGCSSSLKTQVYSLLHASTASAKLAKLVQHQDSYDTNTPQVVSSITASKCSKADNQDRTDSLSSRKPLWKELLDPVTGRKIFMHSVTGNCSHENPCTKDSLTRHNFQSSQSRAPSVEMLGARPLRIGPRLSHDCMPPPKSQRLTSTGLSNRDVFEAAERESPQYVKWRDCNESPIFSDDSREKCESSFESLLKNWRNPIFQAGQEDVLDIGHSAGDRRQIKVHNTINQYTFTKEMFNDLIVLNQVDCKFIACLMSKDGSGGKKNLLVMVDQHAAHERVRLEALIDDLYEDPSASKSSLQVKKSSIQPPLILTLSPSEISMAKHFKHQLAQIGVSTAVNSEGRLLVSSLPSVFMEREASEVRRGRPTVALGILQEMIIKHLELLQTTGGVSTAIPTAITHVLNSQACHGAIKFGDLLTLSECKELVSSLSKCKLPFQCAHGRPSVVPVVDLDSLNRRYPPHQVMPFPVLTKLLHKEYTRHQ